VALQEALYAELTKLKTNLKKLSNKGKFDEEYIFVKGPAKAADIYSDFHGWACENLIDWEAMERAAAEAEKTKDFKVKVKPAEPAESDSE
jgi:hypothetical protein